MTTSAPPTRLRIAATAALFGFLAGAIAMAALVWSAGLSAEPTGTIAVPGDKPAISDSRAAVESRTPAEIRTPSESRPLIEARPAKVETPPPVTPPSPPSTSSPPALEVNPIAELRKRMLQLPLSGATRSDLRSSFSEKRGTSRKHEAIDMLAPRNTPIVAVEEGTIARLFTSEAGGLTVYQFDPTMTYVYYYAHLERYAPGLTERQRVGRGQLLGFVGTSGNAPKDTPHLHFAIFKMTDKKRWWEGTPLDPFEILK